MNWNWRLVTLNGWQRLFVVVAVLWFLVVATAGGLLWPGASDANLDLVIAQMPPGFQAKMTTGESGVVYFSDCRPNLQGLSSNDCASIHACPTSVGGHWLYFEQHMSVQGASGNVPLGSALCDPDTAATEFGRAVSREVNRLRLRFFAELGASWVFPLAALYLLSCSVGWIRRGFDN